MSVTIETVVTCDASLPGCLGTFADGDSRHLSATQQRAVFKNNGWHRSKGKDICEACWAEYVFRNKEDRP